MCSTRWWNRNRMLNVECNFSHFTLQFEFSLFDVVVRFISEEIFIPPFNLWWFGTKKYFFITNIQIFFQSCFPSTFFNFSFQFLHPSSCALLFCLFNEFSMWVEDNRSSFTVFLNRICSIELRIEVRVIFGREIGFHWFRINLQFLLLLLFRFLLLNLSGNSFGLSI